MTLHHCPKCELRFTWKTELDDHCANDHPQFKHDYPVRKASGQQGQQAQPGQAAAERPARSTV